jgi:hypothetical protein
VLSYMFNFILGPLSLPQAIFLVGLMFAIVWASKSDDWKDRVKWREEQKANAVKDEPKT